MRKIEWIKTRYVGVRYFNHSDRKHGVQFDKSFHIRFNGGGKLWQSSLGWASEGMTAEKASLKLARYKRNYKAGKRPWTLNMEKKDADRKAEAKIVAKAAEEKHAITFDQYFKETYSPVAVISKKHNTWKQEGSYYRVWLEPNIGRIKLIDLRPLHMMKVKRAMAKKNKAPRTIQAVLALARQVWNHARNDDVVTGDYPGRSVKAGRFDNRRMRFLTHDECEALISKLREISPQVADMALLSVDTGMRAGEIFTLIWENVNMDLHQIRVVDAKSGRNRTVYLTDRVKDMLQGLPGGEGLVFPSKTGGRIGQISKTVERAILSLGLNDMITDSRNKATFHTLRHTFASRLVENGTDLYTVKELMGHSTLAMTERYSHVSNSSLESAVRRMEEATTKKSHNKVIHLQANEEN